MAARAAFTPESQNKQYYMPNKKNVYGASLWTVHSLGFLLITRTPVEVVGFLQAFEEGHNLTNITEKN